ncbi:delta(3,5)-Delta(2,4)-dienoyl-CoA isomerase, peroxisomal [Primulina tabacum]|uniref:delta(3,5)-Delta(2,4)-dienoyl-CoA isomerase, peroxisomal n=1 Tax=Primulina tabacum TaxID=48773 RepID=UPI003F59A016
MEKQYKSIIIKQRSPDSRVFYIYLNNPSRGNALSSDFFTEFPDAVASLDQNPDVAVIILSGSGKHFCSGIELETLNSKTDSSESTGPGHAAEKLRREIKVMQRAVNAIEECRKPVIALIHGACLGGGVDIAAACDIRYCMQSTFFSVKEVDMALAADLGSLQRLPRIVGFGNAMELALTGRRFTGLEAKELGLVTRVFGTKQDIDQGVESIAEEIAAKSPIAVVGTKRVLLQSRDLTVDQALDYVATWNAAALQSKDVGEAIAAHVHKRKPVFAKL